MHYVEIEFLKTLPFANANRDDAGLPKTLMFGGTTRARLSSQALKRAARFHGAEQESAQNIDGSSAYYRTVHIPALVARELLSRGLGEEDPRVDALGKLFAPKGSPLGKGKDGVGDALAVLTHGEVVALADYFETMDPSAKQPEVLDAVKGILTHSAKRDLALWGRFFASGPEFSMDGAAQVAHAFTTHTVAIESDFFTGMDDVVQSFFPEKSGAGHPGNAFYQSGTFYGYANVNIEEAVKNLMNLRVNRRGILTSEGDVPSEGEMTTVVSDLVGDFIRSLVLSVPRGKIRSTAHRTLPSFVRVSIREGVPVNGSTAFLEPVPSTGSVARDSVERLAREHRGLQKMARKPELSVYLALDDLGDSASIFGMEAGDLDELVATVAGRAGEIAAEFRDSLVLGTGESDALVAADVAGAGGPETDATAEGDRG